MSTAFSSTGILAAGTADGRLWIGLGGQKGSVKNKAKAKSRKWNGLKDEEHLCIKVADGPVVAMCVRVEIWSYDLVLTIYVQVILEPRYSHRFYSPWINNTMEDQK